MTDAVGTAALFILSICVLPEKGQDVRQIFVGIQKELSDQKGVTFLQVVKVAMENRIIATVNVTDVCKLEAIVEGLRLLAAIETTSEPVITYEDFGAQIGVTDTLISPGRPEREISFFAETFIDYYGNTSEELIAVFKESVETFIKRINNGIVIEQAYKHVAERKLSGFIFFPDAAELDTQARNAPLSQRLGSNVHVKLRGVQRLDDYVACRNSSRNY